jgi:hypothetical protein
LYVRATAEHAITWSLNPIAARPAATQVERARAQVAALPHAGSYSELCTALRRQHDEEVAISATLAAQAAALDKAEAAHARAAARLANAGGGGGGGGGGDGDGAAMVAGLTEEVARLRRQVRRGLVAQGFLGGGEEILIGAASGPSGQTQEQLAACRGAPRRQSVTGSRSESAAFCAACSVDTTVFGSWLQVDEQQPREIEARQRRLAALQEALSVEVMKGGEVFWGADAASGPGRG